MIIIGVDPGKGGALAMIGAEWPPELIVKETVDFLVPTGKGDMRDYEPNRMVRWLRDRITFDPGTALAIVEKQSARPGQGVSSMLSLGMGEGLWLGIFAALAIPVVRVAPATWTAAILKGAPGEGKARAISVASNLYPGLELPRAKARAQAIADAVCILRYGELRCCKAER
jgi:hypothetical protein